MQEGHLYIRVKLTLTSPADTLAAPKSEGLAASSRVGLNLRRAILGSFKLAFGF